MLIMLRDGFEVVDYRQMLRAHTLTLAAFDALARLAVLSRKQFIIGEVNRPALLSHVFATVFIVNRKILRYADIHRASFRAVMARRTGNGNLAVDNVRNLKAPIS